MLRIIRMPPRQRATRRTSAEGLPPDRVTIDFAVLGDFAQTTGGKLTVVGAGWSVVNAQQYPQILPFGLGIGILVPWSETNAPHQFAFAIEDADSNQIASGGGVVEAGRQPGMPVGMVQRVVLGIAGQVQLPKPGTYVVVVTAAGDEKRIVFEALPVPGLRIGPAL
jgi:hypothetical protein